MYFKLKPNSKSSNKQGDKLVELEDCRYANVLGAVGGLDAAEDLDLALQEGFQDGRDVGKVDVKTLGA